MREAVRANPARRPSGRFVTLPAPTAGLNLKDGIAQLKPNEALILDNYFPEASYVRLRKGYTAHVTGFAAPVETLMEYASATSRKLFAASDTSIYDATTAGAVGAAAVGSLTNARFQHTMFTTSGGDYLVCVNGADGLQTYDGAAWAVQAVTVANADEWVDVAVWGNRLWFVDNASNKAWYLPSGAIAGAAAALNLGPVWELGGKLQIITPISFNSGSDVEQGIAFISSEGEVALYSGTDPSSTSTFALTGRFRIPAPLPSNRAYTRLNGDCLVMTEAGLISLTSAMRLDSTQFTEASGSAKIDPELKRQAFTQRTTFGWDVFLYPAGGALFINAPQGSSAYYQWVMNTITVAWGRYKAQDALCWSLLENEPYFGGATAVYRADFGSDDNGAAIQGAIKSAFSVLGNNAPKRLTMIRPFLVTNSAYAPALSVDLDFSDAAPVDTAGATTASGGVWGTSLWGVGTWGGSSLVSREWTAAYGLGTWVAPRMATNTKGIEIVLNAFDMVIEPQGANAL